MNHFEGLTAVNEIKALYKKLAFQHHPDRGGDTRIMQDINSQYQAILKGCNGQTSTGSDNKQHTYRYDQAAEQAVMDKLSEIAALGMVDVEIMLIGSWIWITGNTKDYRKELGRDGLKCRWHSKRTAWYWHVPSKRRYRFNNKVDLDGLAATYGCTDFESKTRKPLAA